MAKRVVDWSALLLLVGLAAGCASAPRQAPATVAVPAAVETETADLAPADRPYRGAPTCRVIDSELEHSVELKLSRGGASIATIQDGASKLELGKEPLMLEIEGGGVLLRTPYDPTETPLRLREPIALKGVLTPKPEAAVEWVGGLPNQAQRIRFRSELGSGLDVTDQVACSALTLRLADYTVPLPEGEPGIWLKGRISVRETPDAEPGLVFDAPSGVAASELERKAGFVRILVDSELDVLQGWVPQDVVKPSPGLIGSIGRGFGIGGLGMRGASHIYYTHCDKELRLFARVGDEQGEVGVIYPQTRFEVEGSEPGAHPGFTEIDLWQGRIMPAEGAKFLVYSDELESGCGH
ncbi:MAG: hypothetical protein H6718_23615 [Polyangiaceae bacterium]|nr:hypothetical protein [Myxococcales bacterium]MCB9588416.1 hypothetical protein [Polyangiaceae bacterium]